MPDEKQSGQVKEPNLISVAMDNHAVSRDVLNLVYEIEGLLFGSCPTAEKNSSLEPIQDSLKTFSLRTGENLSMTRAVLNRIIRELSK